MNESTARELIGVMEGLTTAIYELRDCVFANNGSSGELRSELRAVSGDLQRVDGSISDLTRSVDQNTSSVGDLAADVRNASSRY